VLATIAVLFPPFSVDEGNSLVEVSFSFLLDPPLFSDGISLSIFGVEIIACFLLAHIINFIVTKTPKKYLYGIPIFLVIVFISIIIYNYYATELQKKKEIERNIEENKIAIEEIKTAIEKTRLEENHFESAIECNVLIEEVEEAIENNITTGSQMLDDFGVHVRDFSFYTKECDTNFPYVFDGNPTIIINKDTTVLDFNKATEEYINNIELKVIEGLSITDTERVFLGL
jgi:energy-coupling factor transporter transmembrane protein EcfT